MSIPYAHTPSPSPSPQSSLSFDYSLPTSPGYHKSTLYSRYNAVRYILVSLITLIAVCIVSTAPHGSFLYPGASSPSPPSSTSPSARSLLSLRSSLQSTQIVDTTGYGGDAMDIFRMYPRTNLNGEPRPIEMPKVGCEEGESAFQCVYDSGTPYFEGFLGLILLFICLACLSLVSCCMFCLARCTCDRCGGRLASQYYHSSQVKATKIGLLLIFAGIATCAALGWSANIKISQSFDSIFAAADKLADHGSTYIGFATSTYEIGTDGVRYADKILTASSFFDDYNTSAYFEPCVNRSFDTIADLDALVQTVNGIPARDVSDISVFRAQLANYFAQTKAVAYDDVFAEVSAFEANTGAGTLPSFRDVTDDIENMNTAFGSLSTLHSGSDTAALAADNDDILSSSSTLSGLIDSTDTAAYTTAYANYDTAVAGLPDLATLKSNLENPGTASNGDLKTALQSYKTAINTLSSVAATLVPAMPTIDTELNTLTASVTQMLSSLTALDTLLSPSPSFPDVSSLHADVQKCHTWKEGGSDNINTLTALLTASIDTFAERNEKSDFPQSPHLTPEGNFLTCTTTLKTQLNTLSAHDRSSVSGGLSDSQAKRDALVCMYEWRSVLKAFNTSVAALDAGITTVYNKGSAISTLYKNYTDTTKPAVDAYITQISPASSPYTSLAYDFAPLVNGVSNVEGKWTSSEIENLRAQLALFGASLAKLADTSPASASAAGVAGLLGELQSVGGAVEDVLARGGSFKSYYIALNAALSASLAHAPSSEFSDDATGIETSSAGTESLIDDAITHIDGGTYPGADVPSATLDGLYAKITSLINTQNTHPDSSTVTNYLSALDSLHTAMQSEPADDLSAALNSLHTGAPAFSTQVSSSSVISDFSTAHSQRTQLDTYVDACLHASSGVKGAKAAVSALPGEATVDSDMEDAEDDVEALTAAMDGIIDRITMGEYTTVDRDIFIGTVQVFAGIDKERDFVVEIQEDAQDGIDLVSETRDSWQSTYDAYYDQRETLYTTFDTYDGERLLMFNTFYALPFLFCLLGVLSGVFKCNPVAMVMALIFFALIFFFFLMAAVQVPVAFMLADHCDNVYENIERQTGDYAFEKAMFGDTLNLTHDVGLSAHTKYWMSCDASDLQTINAGGDEPEILTRLKDTDYMMREYNVSQVMTDFAAGFTLRPEIETYFTRIKQIEADGILLFERIVPTMDCAVTSALYDDAFDALCLQFAPQFALTVLLYFVTAVLMVPGICCGVRGFKRFNEVNMMGTYDEELEDMEDFSLFGGGGRKNDDW